MARSLPETQAAIRGERITNEALSKFGGDTLFLIGFRRIETQYGPTNVAELRDFSTGETVHTFLSEGVGQRAKLAEMFAESDEPVGPVKLIATPTKAGRSVWVFRTPEEPVPAADDLPF